MGCIVLCGYIGLLLFEYELPWGVNRCFRYIVFYAGGYALQNINFKKKKSTGLAACLLCLLLLSAMYMADLSEGIWFYIAGFMGSVGVLLLSAVFEDIGGGLSKVFSFLGRNTLAIMVMHGPLYRAFLGGMGILFQINIENWRNSMLISLLLTIVIILVLFIPIKVFDKYLPVVVGKKKSFLENTKNRDGQFR